MSIEHTNYDNRRINLQNPPPEYKEYLNSLRCCICGSMEKCKCTGFKISPKVVKQTEVKSKVVKQAEAKSKVVKQAEVKPKITKNNEIKSVCSPHKDWIKAQIILGINGKDIYHDLVQNFEFKYKYTSVRKFIQKLKEQMGNNLTQKIIEQNKVKPKIVKRTKIKSVCSPYQDWIESQLLLGISGKAIYRNLVENFEFKNSYTSVKDFIRKLKKQMENKVE